MNLIHAKGAFFVYIILINNKMVTITCAQVTKL